MCVCREYNGILFLHEKAKIISFSSWSDPPDDISIHGYNDDKSLYVTNKNFTMNCTVLGGNPRPNISFVCSNGVDGKESISTDLYTIRSTVILPLTRKANAVVCRCTVTQSTTYYKEEKVTLNILCTYYYC